jgi:alpha-L-fucosidase 2
MEHYRFTQDKDFLRERAYPVLRENALFFLDWPVEHPVTGKLVSGPSASAENQFRDSEGRLCAVTMGPAQDQEFAWNSFRDFLEACNILGIKDNETREVEEAMIKLALPQIGSDGRLMEWNEEFEEVEPGHRHLSHLWGFMPGNRITMAGTPELAGAVKKSIDFRLNPGKVANINWPDASGNIINLRTRGYDAHGWGLGWVTNILARLKEGDRAYNMLSEQYFKKAFPNMFVAAHTHPQAGDMMGAPLAMIQFILQSHAGEIELLPALPGAWDSGSAKGLCARGGFVVDITWKNGRLEEASLFSKAGGKCKVRYGDKVVELEIETGKTYPVSF